MGVMDAVRHLVGLQAQVPTNPYVGLRARLARFKPAALEALVEAGDVVRTVVMRATITCSPRTTPSRSGRSCARSSTGSSSGTRPRPGDRGRRPRARPALARSLMAERPRSMADLRDAMAAAGFGTTRRSRTRRATSCRRSRRRREGLDADRPTRLAALDTLAGRPLGASTDPTPLVRRYLAAFGPATAGTPRRGRAWRAAPGPRGDAAVAADVSGRARPRVVRRARRPHRDRQRARARPLSARLRQLAPRRRRPPRARRASVARAEGQRDRARVPRRRVRRGHVEGRAVGRTLEPDRLVVRPLVQLSDAGEAAVLRRRPRSRRSSGPPGRPGRCPSSADSGPPELSLHSGFGHDDGLRQPRGQGPPGHLGPT